MASELVCAAMRYPTTAVRLRSPRSSIGEEAPSCGLGNDYDTPDGTGIRDFVHVVDLASGHPSISRHLKQPGFLRSILEKGMATMLGASAPAAPQFAKLECKGTYWELTAKSTSQA